MTMTAMTDTVAMEGVTDALNAGAVDRLTLGEPQWLSAQRMHAWSVYEQTPMPTTRLEEWRYTDLRKKLDLGALRLVLLVVDRRAFPGVMFDVDLMAMRDQFSNAGGSERHPILRRLDLAQDSDLHERLRSNLNSAI